MKRKLYSVLIGERDPFGIFSETIVIRSLKQIDDPNAVMLLHGGADISPSIYKERVSKYCHAGVQLTDRDKFEVEAINQARKLNIPIIGICRGAQLLCALDGGRLIQHMLGHNQGSHTIVDIPTGEIIRANSAHHQMMVPKKERGNLVLAEFPEEIKGYNQNDEIETFPACPEIVWFPRIKGLGIQGHPEWIDKSTRFHALCVSYIKQFVLEQ